jgi:hypothetical protein
MHGDYVAFIYFVWNSEQSVTFVLCNTKRLVFITEVKSVYSAVRTEYLYERDTFRRSRVNVMIFVMDGRCVFCEVEKTYNS